MSSPEREKEKLALAKIDEFAKEHNKKGEFIELIHKRLFALSFSELEYIKRLTDIMERRDDRKSNH